MHREFPAAFFQLADENGIIVILGSSGVDGDDGLVGPVDAALAFVCGNFVFEGMRFVEDGIGEIHG